MPDPRAQLIARTPAPGCPACEARRRHAPEERREYHPLAGHGYAPELGWTHPVLVQKARGEVQI